MQQILNASDRNQAFYKFLLFFIITVALILVAVYFNFRVPVKENAYLQNQLDVQRTQDANQVKFVSKMEDAVVLLDSLDKPNANTDQVLTLITTTTTDMYKLSPLDNSMYGKMDKALWSQFEQLKKAKKQLLDVKNQADRMSSMENDLRNCRAELEQAKRDLDNFRKGAQ